MKQRGGVRELQEVDEKLDNYYSFSDTISVIDSSMKKVRDLEYAWQSCEMHMRALAKHRVYG